MARQFGYIIILIGIILLFCLVILMIVAYKTMELGTEIEIEKAKTIIKLKNTKKKKRIEKLIAKKLNKANDLHQSN